MTTQISGDTGVSQVQDGVVQQSDLAANVVGKGPAFSAYNANGTLGVVVGWQTLALVAEIFDTDNYYDAPNAKWQPLVAGYYQISTTVSLSSPGRVVAGFLKNGVTRYQGGDATAGTGSTCSALVYMNGSTDFLIPNVYSSISNTVFAGEGLSYITGVLVRAA